MKAKTESKTTASASSAPLDAFMKASGAWTPIPAQFAEGWQRQMNAGLRMLDVVLDNAVKVRDAQLPSASEGLTSVAELQKSMLEARTPLQLWTLQCNWMLENTVRAMGFWKGMFDAANAANANLCACLREQAPQAGGSARALGQAAVDAPAGSIAAQDLVKTALVTFDAAYGQMLKSSQQMMAAATEAMNAGMRLGEPEASKPGARRGQT